MDQNPRAHRMFTTRQGNAPLYDECKSPHTGFELLLKVSCLEPQGVKYEMLVSAPALPNNIYNLVGKHNA
eukprot:473097-Amphidinium_carterae.1